MVKKKQVRIVQYRPDLFFRSRLAFYVEMLPFSCKFQNIQDGATKMPESAPLAKPLYLRLCFYREVVVREESGESCHPLPTGH